MSPNTIIRPARQDDCPRMLELIRELAAYERAPDAVTVSPDHFLQSGFGEHPVWWALVAECAGRVEGFALYYIRYSTWKGQRMYLEDIIVTETMRGRGIGKMLMDELIRTAREKGIGGINWQVLDWNEPALNFYRKYPGVRFDDEWVNCALETGKD